MRKPCLLDSNLRVIRDIEPVSASLDLTLEPLSSAELELMPGDSIPERSWVAVYTAYGLAGIFRSRPQRDRYGNRSTSVSLVHGAVEMNDWLTGNVEQTEVAASNAINSIFASYGGNLWTLGSTLPTSPVIYQTSYTGVLDALLAIVEQLPGYMMTFDQSGASWTVNIVPRPVNVTAEGRLSRNIESAEISRDDSELCTRVYMEGLSAPINDATAQAQYGIIEHRISDTGYTAAQAQSIAQNYLNNHKEPKLSVKISAIDLSEITGETLDRITLGTKYRLAIPEDNIVIEQIVCAVRYDDLFSGNPQITLASDPDDVVTILKRQRRSSASSRQQIEQEITQQYQHWTEETDEHFTSVYQVLGVQVDENGDVVYVTDPKTGALVPAHDDTNVWDFYGNVTQTAQSLSSVYQQTGAVTEEYDPEKTGGYNIGDRVLYNGQPYKFIARHVNGSNMAGNWNASHVQAIPSFQSQITQNAGDIALRVTEQQVNTKLEGYVDVTSYSATIGVLKDENGNITGASVATLINGQGQGVVKIDADKVDIDGETIVSYLTGGSLDVYSVTASEVIATDLMFDEGGESPTETSFYTTTIGNKDNPQQIKFLGANGENTQAETIDYTDFPHAHSVSVNQNGVVTLGTVVAVGDQSANFNIADTAFYLSHVGIRSIALSSQSNDDDDYSDWAELNTLGSGTLNNIYGLVRAEDKTNTTGSAGTYHYFRVNATGVYNSGWGAACDELAPPDTLVSQTESKDFSVFIPSTTVGDGTTYDFTMTKGTPSENGGFATVAYKNGNVNQAVARIDISDWWEQGFIAGQGAPSTAEYVRGQNSIKAIAPGYVSVGNYNASTGLAVSVTSNCESQDTNNPYTDSITGTIQVPISTEVVNAAQDTHSAPGSATWVRVNLMSGNTFLYRVTGLGLEFPEYDPSNSQVRGITFDTSTGKYRVVAAAYNSESGTKTYYSQVNREFVANAAIRHGMQQVVWANPSWNDNTHTLTVGTSGRLNASGTADNLTKTVALSGSWHYGTHGQTQPSAATANAFYSVTSSIDSGAAEERFFTQLSGSLSTPTFTFVGNTTSSHYRQYSYYLSGSVKEGQNDVIALANGSGSSPKYVDTTAALNAVSIVSDGWTNGTIPDGYTYPTNTTAKFKTDAPTAATATLPLYLTIDGNWSNDHVKNVYLRPNGSSASNTPVGQLIVDASGLYSSAQGAVKIAKGGWSNGVCSFTKGTSGSDSQSVSLSINVALGVSSSCVVGAKDGDNATGATKTLYVKQDNNYVYITSSNSTPTTGQGGNVVARATNGAYANGQNSVTVTSASIVSNSLTYSGRTATGSVLVELSNGKTKTLTGVDFSYAYTQGLDGGSAVGVRDYEFELEDDGNFYNTDDYPLDLTQIYQQGVHDATPPVTYMYVYASNGGAVSVYTSSTTRNDETRIGYLTVNTKVKFIEVVGKCTKVSLEGIPGTPEYLPEWAQYNKYGYIVSTFLQDHDGWASNYDYLGWRGQSPQPQPGEVTVTEVIMQPGNIYHNSPAKDLQISVKPVGATAYTYTSKYSSTYNGYPTGDSGNGTYITSATHLKADCDAPKVTHRAYVTVGYSDGTYANKYITFSSDASNVAYNDKSFDDE